MSHHASAQIKALSATIADIHIAAVTTNEPRAMGDILRPFMLELRRSHAMGEPMRQEILDRFCAAPESDKRA